MANYRRIAEKKLGRRLRPEEEVHHINFIHGDNRPENLFVLLGEQHQRLHKYARALSLSRLEAELNTAQDNVLWSRLQHLDLSEIAR